MDEMEFDPSSAQHWYFLAAELHDTLPEVFSSTTPEELMLRAMPDPKPVLRRCVIVPSDITVVYVDCLAGPRSRGGPPDRTQWAVQDTLEVRILLESRSHPWGIDSPGYTLMECYAKCLELDPTIALGWLKLAILCHKGGSRDINMGPAGTPWGKYPEVKALTAVGGVDFTIEEMLRKCVESEPHSPWVWSTISDLLPGITLGDRYWSKLDCAVRDLECRPSRVRARLRLHYVLPDEGQWVCIQPLRHVNKPAFVMRKERGGVISVPSCALSEVDGKVLAVVCP